MSSPDVVLSAIPTGLRKELLRSLNSIVSNFRQLRWEPSELNAGKLCEVAYTILRGYVDGSFPAKAQKPKNMVDACRALESAGSGVPRSVRIQIPRMLLALYEIRNNRGVGHVGGDVDPNHMDAVTVVAMSKWVVAELIRVFHVVDTATATAIVETLVEREVPVVWEVDCHKRVLTPGLSMKHKALVLLYAHDGPVPEGDLVRWVEHSNPTAFRRDILRPAHKAKLIEYDPTKRLVHLSPAGARYVEDNLPLTAP